MSQTKYGEEAEEEEEQGMCEKDDRKRRAREKAFRASYKPTACWFKGDFLFPEGFW